MDESESSPRSDAVCDGGTLDCGSGLLLIIRAAMAPLAAGGVLEVRSREISVKEDLPAWCRMVGHGLLAAIPGAPGEARYFIRKKSDDRELAADLERARSFGWKVRSSAKAEGPIRVFARNHSWSIGQPASFDTEDPAPSAYESLLGALAAALLAGFRWRASGRGIEIRNLEAALEGRPEDIAVFLGLASKDAPIGAGEIKGRVFADADADEEALSDLWSETIDRCPIARALKSGAAISITLRKA